MFELGRELKRLFGAETAHLPKDGVTGGDAALLELLDLKLLHDEGKAADVAAGRVGAKDVAQRRLEAAIVWREVARRSGDSAALRKSAATAEMAADAFDARRRPDAWARARVEQGFCALTGAELFGDPGLDAAAAVAFSEARAAARGGLAAPLADVGLAAVQGRQLLATGDASDAHHVAQRFAAPIAALDALTRRVVAARACAAEARLMRADLLCGWGVRLQDEVLLRMAIDDAACAVRRLDPAYEPLTWARAEALRGQALTLWGECLGDVDAISAGATALSSALDEINRDQSPLDWARTQLALAHTLQALGEACADERAFEQAVTCYDRANLVLKDAVTLPLRGHAAGARAVCLARSAELTGDLAVLDAAEAAMKIELTQARPGRDPVGWALAQLNLARLYEARLDITGGDKGQRAAAVTALDAALEVFAEQGLRSLATAAQDALERVRADGRREPRTAI
jgi:tetratricopeptide (TPR) repeat protein